MSAQHGHVTGYEHAESVNTETESLRILALLSFTIATLAYVNILYEVTSIVGGTGRLTLVILIAAGAAVLGARTLTPSRAAVVGAAGMILGSIMYVAAVPQGFGQFLAVGDIIRDWLAILSGFTVLAIAAADVWVAAFAPTPIFLSWYFVLRGRYDIGASVAGLAMLVFVLSGDLGAVAAVLGVAGIAGTIGFGELARRQANIGQADVVMLVIAGILVTSLSFSFVPAGGAQPLSPGSDFDTTTSEDTLIGSEENLELTGNPSLDPEIRFTVTTTIPEHLRVESYDRYTGVGFVQSGESSEWTPREGPRTDRVESIDTRVTLEQDGTTAIPAIWEPVAVDGVEGVGETGGDGLRSAESMTAGDQIFVSSARAAPNQTEMQDASFEYEEEMLERYTQLPDSTPSEVGELTADVIEGTDSPYVAAQRVENYIKTTNEYSLDVDAPEEDIAYEQLFEREAGYCATFAATMVAMLRTQDIPTRFVTGYTTGESVGDDTYAVRGMNAHAWVEVYVPEMGWVQFDPTPSGDYNEAREERLAQAAADGSVQTEPEHIPDDDWEPSYDPGEFPDDAGVTQERAADLARHCGDPTAVQDGLISETEAVSLCDPFDLMEMGLQAGGTTGDVAGTGNETAGADPANDTTDELGPDEFDVQDPLEEFPETDDPEEPEEPATPYPPAEHIGFVLAALVAAAAGVRHKGIDHRVKHEFAVRWQGRQSEPAGVTERAWRRLELHLSRTALERRESETVREYIARLEREGYGDERIEEVAARYERVRHAGESPSPTAARETVMLVDQLTGRSMPPTFPG